MPTGAWSWPVLFPETSPKGAGEGAGCPAKTQQTAEVQCLGIFLIQFDDDLAPTRGKDGEQAAVREVKAGRRVTPPFQWLPEFTVD